MDGAAKMRRKRSRPLQLCLGMTFLGACVASPVVAQSTESFRDAVAVAPDANYWVYVGAESADLLHRIRWGPGGAEVEKTTPVGEVSLEIEGPHGLSVGSGGKYLYMTTGHGVPDGKLWKIEAGPDTVVGEPIGLGFFPATLDVTPDGEYVFVANFNLHGEMVPSTISVAYTPELMEVAQTTTCTMPHGSRISPDGTHQYSACMMDDELVEMDTRSFEVSRRFSIAEGSEGPLDAEPTGGPDHAMHGMDRGMSAMPEPSCSPTWAQPSSDGEAIYVACNRGDEILEISRDAWEITRRFPTGRGPYNLAVTPDGRLLIATLKQGGGVELFDLRSGDSLETIPSSTTVTHGVVVSPDSRYAFVSVEGKGAEPGKVDIYDLRALERVASVEVGQQAGGIAFWKMEVAR